MRARQAWDNILVKNCVISQTDYTDYLACYKLPSFSWFSLTLLQNFNTGQ